jgi:hypothetical protein
VSLQWKSTSEQMPATTELPTGSRLIVERIATLALLILVLSSLLSG